MITVLMNVNTPSNNGKNSFTKKLWNMKHVAAPTLSTQLMEMRGRVKCNRAREKKRQDDKKVWKNNIENSCNYDDERENGRNENTACM